MGLPRSVTRIDRHGGISFTSNVEQAKYKIGELSRAALRDVAKVIRKKLLIRLKKLPGMKRHKRIANSTQYWVRKQEIDLQIGFKHDAWYGVNQELGTKKMKRKSILRDTVFDSIGEIRSIQAQYLSAVGDGAMALIDEGEATSTNE